MDEIVTTSYLKAHLAECIREIRETPTTRVYVGAHRRREAVMMHPDLDVPDDVLTLMLRLSIWEIARECAELNADRQAGDRFLPPEHAVRLLAWLSRRADRGAAPRFLADLLVEVRHGPRTTVRPAPTLDELLAGVDQQCPDYYLSGTQLSELIDRLRDEVPRHYGGDPNGPVE